MDWKDLRKVVYKIREQLITPRYLDIIEVSILLTNQGKTSFTADDIVRKMGELGYIEMFIRDNKALREITHRRNYVNRLLKKLTKRGIYQAENGNYRLKT